MCPTVWPGVAMALTPGAISAPSAYCLMFFQVGKVAWIRLTIGAVGLGQLLHQRRIGPELVLDLGHHDFRVRKYLRVGLLHPQAGDVVGVEMRDHHRGDGRGIEAGGLHVVGELAHRGRAVAAEAGVEQHDLAAGPDRRDRKGVVELVGADARRRSAPS